MATGRSDYPNQVNNVLGFPFIFRGALDVRATTINDEMKLAATRALAALAKEDVPDSVLRAYGVDRLEFGREYIIPKPFDPRVLIWEASAVAQAAMETGVAQQPVDIDAVPRRAGAPPGQGPRSDARHDPQGPEAPQAHRLHRGRRGQDPARLPDPAGRKDRHRPSCWATKPRIRAKAAELRLHLNGVQIVDPRQFPRLAEYTEEFYSLRQRKGVTRTEAEQAGAQPHHLRQPDGAPGRRRRPGRRPHHALSRHHPAGPAGDRRAPRAAPRGRRLRADHPQGRHLLPGRCHREHRTDRRGPGRDRHHGRREGAPLQPGAARGHALVLQLRQHAPSAVRQGAAAPWTWCASALPA